MAKLELKGKTPEEKLEHVQRILKHWERKTRKAIVGIMPPIPILSYVDHPAEDGTVMRAILPADGKIIRVVIFASISGKDPVGFHCTIENMNSKLSSTFEIRNKIFVQDISRDVSVGDILTVKIYNPKDANGQWLAERVFVSLLYEISMKDSTKAQYMMENLERLLEKEDEGI